MSNARKIDFSRPQEAIEVLRAMSFPDVTEMQVEQTEAGVLTLTPARPENLHLVSAEERKRVFEQMADIEFHESSADLIRTIHESQSSSEPILID